MKACNIYSKEKWLWNRFKVCVCMCSSVDFNSNELLTWLSLLPSGVRSHEVKEPLGWRGPLDTSQSSPLLKQGPKNNTLFALQQLLPNFDSLNMVPVQRDTQITGTGNCSGTGTGLWPPLKAAGWKHEMWRPDPPIHTCFALPDLPNSQFLCWTLWNVLSNNCSDVEDISSP